MKRKLTNDEIYFIVRMEEEIGCQKLIYDLADNPNAEVYAEIKPNGSINFNKLEIKK